MANGLQVINGVNPLSIFDPRAGFDANSLSQRALAAMQARQPGEMSELGGGITGGFGVIGYKGKAWHIKYNGEDTILKDVDPRTGMETNRSYIELVIIKATNHLTKTWYEQAYVEGSNAPPDCASSNGITPDLASPKRQSDLCATCKWNQFGSRVSADGNGRGKACQDTKRLAVVPAQDLENEANGGPMLLRIPPASLRNLQNFAGLMDRNGYPFWAVAVYLYFEGDEAYPQINFKPSRPLSDDGVALIQRLRDDERVQRILNTAEVQPQVAPALPPQEPLFGAPPGVQIPAPVPQQAPQAATQPAYQPAPVQPQPAPQPVHQPLPEQQFMPHPQPAPVQAAPVQAPPVQAAPPVPQAPVQPMPQEPAQQPLQAAPPAPQAPAPVQAAPAVSEAPGAPVAAADFDSFLDSMAGM
jgi:hypothetical protein